MKYYFVFFTFLLFITLTTLLTAQTESGSFEFEGYTRNYIVFLPQNYEENMPIVLNLHGYTDNAIWQMQYSAMNDVADTAGFIVVYPNSIPPGFNSGSPDLPDLPKVDDVTFISVLLDTLYALYNYDRSRVYCCGFSNGAHMTHRLACELRYRFAAAASISGVMNTLISGNYIPLLSSIPILLCHGTKDNIVHYNSVQEGMYGVEETVDFWVRQNECLLEPDTVHIADIVTTDNCHVEKISYSNCIDNNQVFFYKVIDGGHSWPSGTKTGSWAGNTNRDINGSEEIWNFFKNFVNPYSDIAACDQIKLDPMYIQPAGDTLNITAHIVNPNDHPITVTAKIKGLTSPFNDSLQLTTDGYGEEMMDGSFISSDLEEEIFAVRVFTEDHSSATIQCLHKIVHFTTIGPVQAAESPTIDCNYNERYKTQYFQLVLQNKGTVATAVNLEAKISSTDPRVKKVLYDTRGFPDLAAGEIDTISISKYYAFNYAEDFSPDSTFNNPIQFNLTVSSDGYPFWKSTFNYVADTTATAIEVNFNNMLKQFALHQNYPNPFNPATVIEYDLPRHGHVRLDIYDLLGRHIRTLVDTQQPVGHFQTIWDGTDEHNMKIGAGVYFCRLKAGDFVKVIKLALVK